MRSPTLALAAVTLTLSLCAGTARAFTFADFTGNAVVDMPAGTPGLFINNNTTPGGAAAWGWIGGLTGAAFQTGWYIYDLRYIYESGTDTAFFCECLSYDPLPDPVRPLSIALSRSHRTCSCYAVLCLADQYSLLCMTVYVAQR